MTDLALANNPAIGRDLEQICPGRVTSKASLKALSRWRIGGSASWAVEPASASEVSALVQYLVGGDIPYLVIGDGSNLLFDDQGTNAVIVRIGQQLSQFRIMGDEVHAQAGVWVPRLSRNVGCAGLAGLEHTIGIPGTLGGLVCMNGGSQRKGIGDSITEVTAVLPNGEVRNFTRAECDFSYRDSVFQKNGAIVVAAKMRFSFGDTVQIRRKMLSIMKERRTKFPLKLPNCGSVFVSDPKMYEHVGPPGKAIEDAGFKGLKLGNAQSSPLHANFIVNLGNARSDDVIGLIRTIRDGVFARTGYQMDCEVRYVTHAGLVVPLHDALKYECHICN